MKPISFLDMREYDRNAVWLGVPEESLMENAGKGAAEISRMYISMDMHI
jgi:NAD(P)H-hydrate repair Nnr-like enzyme with NAD(P)H-hydrate epimerase domain